MDEDTLMDFVSDDDMVDHNRRCNAGSDLCGASDHCICFYSAAAECCRCGQNEEG